MTVRDKAAGNKATLTLIAVLCVGGQVWAQQPDVEARDEDVLAREPAWVTDQLRVPLRSGPSGEHRIIHWGIPTGSELAVLDVDDAANFTRVRTADGMVGWIPSQYIVREPIARNLLEDAQLEIRSLRRQLDDVNTRHQAALLDEFKKAWGEDFDGLLSEHRAEQRRSEQPLEPWIWALIGGGLLLLGLLLGVAIKSRPRRSPW